MRHAIDHRKLRRDPAHRKALLRNLMNALVRSERIETTVAKAKELRRLADRLITLGKRDTIHARRRVFSLLSDKKNTAKIFEGLAGRFIERAGGYTRIVRTGFRVGDGAEMAILEYLPVEEKKAGTRKGKKKKKAAAGAKGGRAGSSAKAKGKGKEKEDAKKASSPRGEAKKPVRAKKAPKEEGKAE
jgi:large subunit ribosomal protein L17